MSLLLHRKCISGSYKASDSSVAVGCDSGDGGGGCSASWRREMRLTFLAINLLCTVERSNLVSVTHSTPRD